MYSDETRNDLIKSNIINFCGTIISSCKKKKKIRKKNYRRVSKLMERTILLPLNVVQCFILTLACHMCSNFVITSRWCKERRESVR